MEIFRDEIFKKWIKNHVPLKVLRKAVTIEFDRIYCIELLKYYNGNTSQCARAVKMDRSNFLRVLRACGVKAEDYRKTGKFYGKQDL